MRGRRRWDGRGDRGWACRGSRRSWTKIASIGGPLKVVRKVLAWNRRNCRQRRGTSQPHNSSFRHSSSDPSRAGSIAISTELRSLTIIQRIQSLGMLQRFMLAKFKHRQYPEITDCRWSQPDGEVFIKHSSPPRRHCHTGGARPTFTEGNPGPLRWDLLSQGRGLFLKQTHPSTDRRLVSEPAARA